MEALHSGIHLRTVWDRRAPQRLLIAPHLFTKDAELLVRPMGSVAMYALGRMQWQCSFTQYPLQQHHAWHVPVGSKSLRTNQFRHLTMYLSSNPLSSW